MDSQRAAEVLRGDNNPSVNDMAVAAKFGAVALEAWAWVERNGADVTNQSGKWHCAVGWFTHTIHDTPLAAVLDAMAKEGKG